MNDEKDCSGADVEARLREALEHYAKEYCEGWCEQDAGCAQFDLACGGCLARRALSAHPHASDCDKQGYTLTDLLAGVTAENIHPEIPVSPVSPSDRTDDVTVEELDRFLRNNGYMYLGNDEDECLAQTILDKYKVGRR